MLRIAVLAFTVALGSTSGAIAQRGDATSRDGSRLWYGFGVAPGWARVSCAICAANRPAGISAFAAIGGNTSRVVRALRYSQTDIDVGRRRRLLVSEHPSPLLPQGRRRVRHAPRQRRHRRHHFIGNRAADGRGLSIPVQPRLARRAILPLFGGRNRRRREVQWGTGSE